MENSDQDVSLKDAIKHIFDGYIPCTVIALTKFMMVMADYVVLGQWYDSDTLSAYSLAVLTLEIVIMSIDFSGGIDTLVSHAYGRGEYKLGTVYLWTSVIVVLFGFVPQATVILCYRTFHDLIGQEKDISEQSGEYLIPSVAGYMLYTVGECFKRYMEAVGNMTPILIINLLTFAFQISLLIPFMIVVKGDLFMLGVINSLIYLFHLFLIFVYFKYYAEETEYTPIGWFSKIPFTKIRNYIVYGIPSGLMWMIEIWCFQIIALMSGWYSSEALVLAGILLNYVDIFNAISEGISDSSISYVGHSLAQRNPRNAIQYIKAVYAVSFSSGILLMGALFALGNNLVKISSNDEEVIRLYDSIFIIFVFMSGIDVNQCAKLGIIKAIGYQKLACGLMVVGYYGFTIPLSYYLGFQTGLNYSGIWIPFVVSNVLLEVTFTLVFIFAPWEDISEKAAILEEIQNSSASEKKYDTICQSEKL